MTINRKIRVLHVITSLQAAGAERVVVELASNLDRAKFDTMVLSTSNLINSGLAGELTEKGIPFMYFDGNPGFNLMKHIFVARKIKAFKPDIIHTQLSGLFFSLPAVFIRKSVIKIHTVQSIFQKDVGFCMHLIYRVCFLLGVIPVAVSEKVRQSIKQCRIRNNIAVIPNCVSVKFYQNSAIPREAWRKREGFNHGAVLLICIARLSVEKNQLLLLFVFSRIAAKNHDLHLLFVGRGKLMPLLKRQAERLRISDKVHFLGERCDIPEILNAVDIFVLPSKYEGRSLSAMEAMAAAKPVVITEENDISRFISNGIHGMIVPPNEAGALEKAITLIISNPELRASMGKAAAFIAAANFDSEIMVRQYESLYLTLAGKQ